MYRKLQPTMIFLLKPCTHIVDIEGILHDFSCDMGWYFPSWCLIYHEWAKQTREISGINEVRLTTRLHVYVYNKHLPCDFLSTNFSALSARSECKNVHIPALFQFPSIYSCEQRTNTQQESTFHASYWAYKEKLDIFHSVICESNSDRWLP